MKNLKHPCDNGANCLRLILVPQHYADVAARRMLIPPHVIDQPMHRVGQVWPLVGHTLSFGEELETAERGVAPAGKLKAVHVASFADVWV